MKSDTITALILEVFRLNGRLLAAGDGLVADLGLTSARWQVLGAASMAEGGATVSDLARAMGLTRQAVQRVANELIDDGLLAAAANPRHRRAPLMQPTRAGQSAYDRAIARQEPWALSLARNVDDAGLAAALNVLRRLRETLDETPVDGASHAAAQPA